MKKYLSFISIAITIVAIVVKINIDMEVYKAFQYANHAAFAFPKKLIFAAFPLVVLGMIFAIYAVKYKNKFSVLAISLNIVAVMYVLVPVGMFLVRN